MSEANASMLDAKRFPALAVLQPGELRELQVLAELRQVAADVAVVREGEKLDALFFVVEGFLRVAKRHRGEVFEVGTIGPGDLFGEASALTGAPAGAEVRTAEPCTLWAVPAEIVREIAAGNERFERLLRQLAERRQAATALAVNPVFSKLPMAVREVVLYNARLIQVDAGEVICAEGAPASLHMYLILQGEAEAYMRHPHNPKQRIVFARLGPGDEVGEISLVTKKPQAATVRAKTPMKLLAIDAEMVDAWRKRYRDFDYALYACVQRKLQHALEAVRHIAGDDASTIDLSSRSAS